MTPVQIAYFKHFLFDKGIVKIYVQQYQRYRIKGSPKCDKGGNPESIEQFFLQTTVEDVIMKAFIFYVNKGDHDHFRYSYDYWKDVDDNWQVYMKSNESNFSNDSWPLLCRSFSILRQNWDIPFYFKRENFESTEEVYERMHISLPLPDFRWKHGSITKEDSLEEPEPAKTIDNTDKPLLDFVEQEEEEDPLSEFEFLDLTTSPGCRLARNEISINSNKGYKITFNSYESVHIDDEGMLFARLAKNKDGDICLIMNRKNGARLSKTSLRKRLRSSITINSKDMVLQLRTILNIKPDYSIVKITPLNSTSDYLIYKLSKL